jgi:hypothetical protein
MKERPILFSGPMVRAILEGRKTQTRRIVKHIPMLGEPAAWCAAAATHEPGWVSIVGDYRRLCPHGQPADRLWVKENFYSDIREPFNGKSVNPAIIYAATPEIYRDKSGKTDNCRFIDHTLATREQSEANLKGHKWQRLKPSIFMPRWASRLTLEITSVRVERLQDISRGDAIEEGCPFQNLAAGPDPRRWYADLWESINGAGSWAKNPWVWAIEFKRVP